MKPFSSHVSPRRKAAFTLIELLVVIAVIAILAAILFPVFARARENARRAACLSNMKQIGLGIMQYVQDFDEKFPAQYSNQFNFMATKASETTASAPYCSSTAKNGSCPISNVMAPVFYIIQPYIKNVQVYVCPSAPPFVDVAGCGANCAGPTSVSATSYYMNGVIIRDLGNSQTALAGVDA